MHLCLGGKMHNRYFQEQAQRIRDLSKKIDSLGLLSKQKDEKAFSRCDFDDGLDDLEDDIRDYKPRRARR